MNIRTRFAPSPTGELHIGVARTALFAWLIAKQAKGQFILRIEDTDKNREVEGALERIQTDLTWLGLDWDEGPKKGGDYGPYIQSERIDIYHKWAKKLIDKGLAYADPYSEKELQEFRDKAKIEKRPFHYRDHRPKNPPTWDGSTPLRFRIDATESPEWHDAVRGTQKSTRENIDDFIIIKSDGYPTYNFAHIVDDAEMKVTHIVRSDEFLSSMPKFLLLYEALEIEPPIFVHVPPILAIGGGKKLSKRDGASSVAEYRELGYLPDALINYIVLLGWNDGTEKDIYSVDELLKVFSIEGIGNSGAQFDLKRLNWVNAQHLNNMKDKTSFFTPYWPKIALTFDKDYLQTVLDLVEERVEFGAQLSEYTYFFFEDPKVGIEECRGKLNDNEAIEAIEHVASKLAKVDFNRDEIEKALRDSIDELKSKPGLILPIVRLATTGTHASPPLFDTLAVLGKETVMRRLNNLL